MEKFENKVETKNNIELLEPSMEYKDSFIEAMQEFLAEGKNDDISEGKLSEESIKKLEDDFESFLNELKNKERGINLPEGYAPSSVRWLIDNKEYIGRISIRHNLVEKAKREIGHIGYAIRPSKRKMGYGNQILKLGLERAKEIGLTKVLLLCDDNNVGSIGIIEKNGGVLQDKIDVDGKLERRYWIDVK